MLLLLLIGALRSRGEFRDCGRFLMYLAALGVAVVLNVALYVVMERPARQATPPAPQVDIPELRELDARR